MTGSLTLKESVNFRWYTHYFTIEGNGPIFVTSSWTYFLEIAWKSGRLRSQSNWCYATQSDNMQAKLTTTLNNIAEILFLKVDSNITYVT